MNMYRERLTGVASSSTLTLETRPVEYVQIRVIERIAVQNKNSASGKVLVYLSGYGYNHYVAQINLTSNDVTIVMDKPLTLREEEGLSIAFDGLTPGDNVEVWLTGYEQISVL